MKTLLVIAATLFFSSIVNAQMDEKLEQMCGKIKQCSLEQAGADDMPPEVQQMMLQMFDGMCKSMLQPYYNSVGEAGLEKKAEACMDTFLNQSCATLMANQGEYTSPECEDFKAAADEAGIDVGE
jgi:hypothetical protein